jgi:hypothetical protein
MVRVVDCKYVHYEKYDPQYFNLNDDPREINDLGEDPKYADVCAESDRHLRQIVNPTAANA